MRLSLFSNLLSTFRPTYTGFNISSTGNLKRGTMARDIWATQPNVNVSRSGSPSIADDTSDTASIISDAVSSIFDTADIGGDDDGSSVSSLHSSNAYDDDFSSKLIGTSYDSDSEDADREDYLEECYSCEDCVFKRLAQHALIHGYDMSAYKHVPGTGSLALANLDDEILPARYVERNPSYYPNRRLTPPMPIGQRPYKHWPLPIGEGRPIRSPYQGQKVNTYNVTQAVTPADSQPVEENSSKIPEQESQWDKFIFHFTPPPDAYEHHTDTATDSSRGSELGPSGIHNDEEEEHRGSASLLGELYTS